MNFQESIKKERLRYEFLGLAVSLNIVAKKKIFIWIFFYLARRKAQKINNQFYFENLDIILYNSDDRFNKISLSTKCGSFLIFHDRGDDDAQVVI